jgi:hypothetical protein
MILSLIIVTRTPMTMVALILCCIGFGFCLELVHNDYFQHVFYGVLFCNFMGLLSLNVMENLGKGYCVVQTTTSFAFLSISVG